MAAESVNLLGLQMWMCLVCVREWRMGEMWSDGFDVLLLICFFFLSFVLVLRLPLFLWLGNHVRTGRVFAPRVLLLWRPGVGIFALSLGI